MKLKILAAVVAGAFVLPMAVQAEVASTMSIDGDIGVFYSDSTESIGELGSEININGSAEQDGVTYMGHVELDVNGTGNSLRTDEVRVGAKGGFGEVWLGEVDNACDQFDPDSSDVWLGGQSQSCRGADASSILYKNKMGPAEFAVSHNPSSTISQSAIGAKFGAGPVDVNLGYETGVTTSAGADNELFSFGVAADLGNGFLINAEGNDDDDWGVNTAYVMNNHAVWFSYGEDATPDERIGLGYKMSHGKMDYVIEYKEQGNNDETIAGMRYRF